MSLTMNTSFANRDMMDLVFVDYESKKPFMSFDLANATGYNLTGSNVYAFGGHGHPRRVTFSGDRNGSLTIGTQMQTMKLYQLVTGADVSSTASILQREVLTIASNKVTLSKVPVANSVYLYAENDDCGTALTVTVDEDDTTGKTYDYEGTGKVIAYYLTSVSTGVTNLQIKSSSFPKAMIVYGTTYMRTEDEEIVPYKMIAYKAIAQPEFSVDFSNDGDPATIQITMDLMADSDDNILDLIAIEDEDE